ncbi:hypothetical protein [Polaromonas glacialis]|uniref:hypothetical protein n=1 Tax=Polaromonas glacialis TaxID=866564 RepID=UPI0012EB454F|nr:hypothetical protein [Polaromonas glacialis]
MQEEAVTSRTPSPRGQGNGRKTQHAIPVCLALKLGSTPAFVDGDPTCLVQVLSNLLNNAAECTPHSGKIVLALEVRADQVHLHSSQ